MDRTNQHVAGPPVLAAQYAQVRRDGKRTYPYVQDYSDASGKLLAKYRLPAPDMNDFELRVEYVGYGGGGNSDAVGRVAVIVAVAAMGVAVAMVQYCKQTGRFPCGASVVRRPVVRVKKAENGGRAIEVAEKVSVFCYLEFAAYVVGYVCLGFWASYLVRMCGYLLDTGLILSRKRLFVMGEQYNIGRLEIGLVALGFAAFFGTVAARRSRIRPLFYDCQGDAQQTNVNWRTQLLCNKYQQLQRERPGYFWFALLAAMMIYEYADIQFVGGGGTYMFYPEYYSKPLAQATLFLAINNLLLLATNLFKMLLHFLYPSLFLKF